MIFLHDKLNSSELFQLDFKCFSVGIYLSTPSFVTFYLNENRSYRQAMIVNGNIKVESSVSGRLFQYTHDGMDANLLNKVYAIMGLQGKVLYSGICHRYQ